MAATGQGILVTGTDTGIGKTFVSTLLLRQLATIGVRSAGLKPVASGCAPTKHGLRNADAEGLIEASAVSLEYSHANRYAFEPPIAPHIAAEREGVKIEAHLIREDVNRAFELADYVVIEGVGGWRVPLSRNFDFADLAHELALPVLLVVGMRLGCINHALLTVDAINRSGLALSGWVANYFEAVDSAGEESVAAIRDRLDEPLLGIVPYIGDKSGTGFEFPDLAKNLIPGRVSG